MKSTTHPGATKAPDTAAFNQWAKSALADPARASQLKIDWRKLMQSELALSEEQKQHLFQIPAPDANGLQEAIAKVVDHGGTIHIERDSETSPGLLIVKPKASGAKAVHEIEPHLSVGIFHCTFNAHCRNWRCGWGPSPKKP